MARESSVRARRRSAKKSTRALADFNVVLSSAAREVLGEEAVHAALTTVEATNDATEIVLWRGDGTDRVEALINRFVETIFVVRAGEPGANPAREAAVKRVSLGIGGNPHLPNGAEYVRRVSGIWKGLLTVE